MRHAVVRWTLTLALSGGGVSQAVFAQEQEAQKSLPTLLIKGEVVSVDTSDPQAALLKVKDRYGFETPIHLSGTTKITQGDQTLTAADLATGAAIEVEYNFDINTAKRHAVSVAVSAPAATAAAAPAAAPTPSSAPAEGASTVPASPTPEAAPAAPSPEAASAPSEQSPTTSTTP